MSELIELKVTLGELKAQLSKLVVARIFMTRALSLGGLCSDQLALVVGACEVKGTRSGLAVAVADAQVFEGVKERRIGDACWMKLWLRRVEVGRSRCFWVKCSWRIKRAGRESCLRKGAAVDEVPLRGRAE